MTDQRLTRIEAKIDQILETQSKIIVEQVEIKKDLAYHIKRTHILETAVKPLLAAHTFVKVSLALIAASGAVAGIIRLFQ